MSDFPPAVVAAVAQMHGFPAPWGVAGGWALDLFLGRVTRTHGDIDLALFRKDQARLRRHLAGWKFRKVDGGVLMDWPEGQWLDPPVHEVYGSRTGTHPPSLEFLLNERVEDHWVFRRNSAVHLAIDRAIIHSPAGVPVLCPTIVLLYKAKQLRDVDERDFEAVHRRLDPEQRAWLRTALQQVHPEHPWSDRLRSDP